MRSTEKNGDKVFEELVSLLKRVNVSAAQRPYCLSASARVSMSL